MIYAQITNNLIVNVIEIDDPTIVSIFAEGYDDCIQIDTIVPQPSIGWSYDGTNFSNQAIIPSIVSFDGVPSGVASTFTSFTLSDASNGYTVSINGDTISIDCQNYDYKSLRYVLYMLLTQNAGSIGTFMETDAGIMQNNIFVVTNSDANLIYAALCTLN